MNTIVRCHAACKTKAWVRALAAIQVLMALMIGISQMAAQAQDVRIGNRVIPASSIEHRKDIGIRAHTNIQFLIGPPGGGRLGWFGGLGPGGGLTPDQMRQAYNLPSTGGSQIIAIVDAYHNPNALADFNSFSSQFGLASETSSDVTASTNKVFQVLYASGTKPGTDSTGGWELEESLDVQWAHAMAPNAKILLVEADTPSFTNLLIAEDAATNYVDGNGLTPKEISNSWGGSEFSGEQDYDSHFSGTSAVYFVSAGDNGAPANYPSASPFVISAGGTKVNTDGSGNFVSETGWTDGGGGPSAYEPIPSFQTGISSIVGSVRGTPDISYEGDPATGVSVYDTYPYHNQSFTWWIVGGTSLSSPALAGIANLAATAQGTFPAGSQALLTTIYKNLGTSNFRDITSGNNGYPAGTGWDFVTGVGSCLGLAGLQSAAAPIADPQTVNVGHNTASFITLTGSDSDIPPLPLTFAVVNPPANGTLGALDPNTGDVTYTPNAGFQGADSFTFTVTNGFLTSLPATVTLNVAPGTPVANAQTVAVVYGTPAQITLTGSDPDTPALPLTFAIGAPPANGTLSGFNATTGAVTYTPNANFHGADSFTFTVSNGTNISAAAAVTLNVAPGTPTANAQTASVAHGLAKALTLTGSDPDTPALPITFAIATSPSHGTLGVLNAATGAVTYTPNANFGGTDTFTFTVSNGTNTSAAATVTLNVAPGTPTATGQNVVVVYNTATGIALTGTDPDVPALPLTFAIATTPSHGTLSGFNPTTGAVTYTPTANFHGSDAFTFTVTNGVNKSAAATVTLTVSAGTPTAKPQAVTVAHNTAKAITLTGTDPDVPALPLTFAIAVSPSHGTLSGLQPSTGAVTYTPTSNYQGTDTFTFTVYNGFNKSAPATVTLTIGAGTPTANPQTLTVAHNTPKAITLTGVDPDVPALPLTFAIGVSPAHGTLSGFQPATGAVTYTPTVNFQGTDSFTFTVTDGANKSAQATVSLTVGAGAPIAKAQSVSVPHNTAKAITLTGFDPDVPALPLTFAIGVSPAHGTLSGFQPATGAVTYTPTVNFQGTDSFTFTVTNGAIKSAQATVTLTVGAGTPTAKPQTVSVPHGTPVVITLTGFDPDVPPLPLTFTLTSEPTQGSVSAVNATTGVVTYTPHSTYSGPDSFSFTVSNGSNKSSAATVTLNIAAGNPVANSQTVAVAHGQAKTITLTGSDPDSPALPLTFALATSPSHGSLSALNVATGVITYTPVANYTGQDSFTFTVRNGANKSAPATVTLNVAAGIPIANPQTVSIAHGTAKLIMLTGTDTDSPSLPLTFAIATIPLHGALSAVNATTGAVTYTPQASFHGQDSFTFTVSNGVNKSVAATVTLNVAAGTPVALAQTVVVAHNTATAITLTGSDSESPALPLTFAVVTAPSHGALSGFVAATGKVTYTPQSGYSGPDSFTFTVSNGANKSAPATVTITVK